MKIEVRIAPVDDGGEILRHSIIGNRGRLRQQGVRYLNDHFPMWQALHDKVMAAEGSLPDDLIREARRINGEVSEKCLDLGARAAVIFVDLPAIAESAALDDRQLWQDRITCLLGGLTGPDCTLHLSQNDPAAQAALAAHLAGEAPDTPLDDRVAVFHEARRGLDLLNETLGNLFPDTHIVARPGASGMPNPRHLTATFFSDIGVPPQTQKLGFGTPLDAEATEDVNRRIAAYRSDGATGTPQLFTPPVSRDTTAQLPLTIFFMVEPGPLEAQAHLLVASLMVNCRDLFRMVGFCRHDRMDGLHPETRSFLESCGVTLRTIENTFADGYPAGNKLIAASRVQAEGWALFMDSDMCLMRESSFMSVAVRDRTAVCLDTLPGWARGENDYKAVAEALGFGGFPPQLRFWDGKVAHPSYNAGLVLFAPAGRDGKDFGRRWYDNAMVLDRHDGIARKRPWLDTIALAGTIAQERNHRPLPLEWNCTTRLADAQTRVLHYHGLRQIRGNNLTEDVSRILAASPSPHNSYADFMHAHKVEMSLPGDLERRAMRHGIQTV
jgi:hypothetical protein